MNAGCLRVILIRRYWMRRRGYILLLGTVAITAAVNVLAWESAEFCDFYVSNIFPLWVESYARLTGIFPFSVGEVMIVMGLAVTAVAVLLGIIAVIFLLGFKKTLACPKILKFCRKYYTGYAWIVTGVFVLLTLNCFIPYHSSTLEEKYGLLQKTSADDPIVKELLKKEYTFEELAQLRDYIVIKTNELAKQVERDENGDIIYPENINELAADAMYTLAESCPQLEGYYPKPKVIHFSEFLSQQHMKGYFFPFSMEANYNGMMHSINVPATICHEYAHLKGFMYEEEANMIGFLACVNSPDVTFQYSGYLSILNYVNNQFYHAIGKNKEIYAAHVKISPQVKEENVFLVKEAWDKVEEKAIISTSVVDKVSDTLSETSMVLNGVSDGILSYTRVVGLLLHYYDGSSEVQEALAAPEYYVQYK